MKHTAHLNLNQPEGTDKVNITPLNANMDTLDAAVHANQTAVAAERTRAEATEERLSGAVTDLTAASVNAGQAAALHGLTLGYSAKNMLSERFAGRTNNGITFIVNDDGSVTASGTLTGSEASCNLVAAMTLAPGDYIGSGCPAGGSSNGYRIIFSTRNPDTDATISRWYDYGNDVSFTIPDGVKVRASVYVTASLSEPVTFYPMIRSAEIDSSAYEPHQDTVAVRLSALEARIAALEGAHA